MNPQQQVCPNPDCHASGKDGHIGIHSRVEQRYRCHRCKKTFSESYGTALYGIKKSPELLAIVVSLLAYGCPVQAIVATYQLDERTVWAWLERAGQHCQRLHEGELAEAQLELGQIQADELKINTFSGVIWMGLVLMVSTRLWLGGAVSPSRGKALLRRVFAFAAHCGRAGSLLIGVDGLNLYLQVIPEIFQRHWDWVSAQWQGWNTAVVQTLKQKGGKRGRIDREIAWGDQAFIRQLIGRSQGKGWINRADIERLNATFRARMACLVRDGRALVRQEAQLEAWMWLVGTVYNWATYHQSLGIELQVSERKRYWLKRTPAIASQLTDHRWTVADILKWKRPLVGALRKRLLEGIA
jgi:transposase-like protein